MRAGDDFDRPFVDESKQVKVNEKEDEEKKEKERETSKADIYADLFDDDEFDVETSRVVQLSTNERKMAEDVSSTTKLSPSSQRAKESKVNAEGEDESEQALSTFAQTTTSQDIGAIMSVANEKDSNEE